MKQVKRLKISGKNFQIDKINLLRGNNQVTPQLAYIPMDYQNYLYYFIFIFYNCKHIWTVISISELDQMHSHVVFPISIFYKISRQRWNILRAHGYGDYVPRTGR